MCIRDSILIINRDIQRELLRQLEEYPIVTILGPRQAGKTTLARSVLSGYQYINLEDPEIRQKIQYDAKRFLSSLSSSVILDEIQRTPELLSYLQVLVDEEGSTRKFVLTGSHQLELRAAISQSLAGRTSILNLLPLSIKELNQSNIRYDSFSEYVVNGFLPRVYKDKQRPHLAYRNYYQTYVERDVRQLVGLKEASLFEKFMKLLAGRTGQLMNADSLGNDVGVSSKTIKHWLSVLEASFIVFKLTPFHNNFGKRVIKSPKYYFTECGLLAYLLDLDKPEQLERDPLVGNIFENLVVIELLKARYNSGLSAGLHFFRDSNGNEIDVLLKQGGQLTGVEIKSSSTWHSSLVKNLHRFSKTNQTLDKEFLVYNGESFGFGERAQALNFQNAFKVMECSEA